VTAGPPPSVAVVGAGMAGAACARGLADAGWRVTVFDKARGAGGRCATRRIEPFRFDHGAQYFTARDPAFCAQVEAWRRRGVVAAWEARIGVFEDGAMRPAGDETRRYVGVPGMSAMVRDLLDGVDLRLGVRFEALAETPDGWRATDSDGASLGPFGHVAVTAPAPQAADLLAPVPALAARAAVARLAPCWALMAGFAAPLELPVDGAFVNGGALRWLARSASKPGRGPGESWVAHADPDWSAVHLEREPDEVVSLLAGVFADLVGRPLPAIRHLTAHRWRFALPAPALDEPCLYDPARRLGAAGDWCDGPRVEGAYLSGRALASRIAESEC